MWRKPCQGIGGTPALSATRPKTREKCDGRTADPSSRVNTSPASCHASPRSIRSWFWAAFHCLNAFTVPTVGEQRRLLAKAHLGDIRRLDRDIKATKVLIGRAVAASNTTVTDIYGVGPIVAAFLIGYTGDITRFPSTDHYAAYNGTAPIEVSSGGKKRHRLSLRGNRKLNHAIHMAAVTQIRFNTPGRVYYDKKQAEGKTKKEALRALKRRISDAVYRQLLADQQTPQI